MINIHLSVIIIFFIISAILGAFGGGLLAYFVVYKYLKPIEEATNLNLFDFKYKSNMSNSNSIPFQYESESEEIKLSLKELLKLYDETSGEIITKTDLLAHLNGKVNLLLGTLYSVNSVDNHLRRQNYTLVEINLRLLEKVKKLEKSEACI